MIVLEVANIAAFKNDKDAAAPALDRCNIINIVSVIGNRNKVANYEPVGSLEYAVWYVFHRDTIHAIVIQITIEQNNPACIMMRCVAGSKNWPIIKVKIGIIMVEPRVIAIAFVLSFSLIVFILSPAC